MAKVVSMEAHQDAGGQDCVHGGPPRPQWPRLCPWRPTKMPVAKIVSMEAHLDPNGQGCVHGGPPRCRSPRLCPWRSSKTPDGQDCVHGSPLTCQRPRLCPWRSTKMPVAKVVSMEAHLDPNGQGRVHGSPPRCRVAKVVSMEAHLAPNGQGRVHGSPPSPQWPRSSPWKPTKMPVAKVVSMEAHRAPRAGLRMRGPPLSPPQDAGGDPPEPAPDAPGGGLLPAVAVGGRLSPKSPDQHLGERQAKVDLSGNLMEDVGAKVLAKALQINSTLQEPHLGQEQHDGSWLPGHRPRHAEVGGVGGDGGRDLLPKPPGGWDGSRPANRI
ncbi:uncharacterized protein LOC126037272 isoform X2 [Accipiter gentilis]|uniref:uncharacterized protein LOC126037272 isoform X2 n=1 Tax=Astur gentilis TaxID=8957 RepID=UPI00210F89FB|nr:uncharacterized protein LOC126037272 isoform X2 [Accipiter gentilis]